VVLGIDVFDSPKGREYALPWGDLKDHTKSGSLKMSDYLFNYYFLPVAFGADGAFYTRTVHASSGTITRRIGGPSKAFNRKEYTLRVTPTWRGGAYDAGTQLYAVDGDKLWNFEITGRVTEFRIWIRNCGRLGQLKRTLAFKTVHGTSSSSLALAAGN